MTAEQQKEENKSMTVGQKIKYFRKRKGYTQKEVGELLGFSGTVSYTHLNRQLRKVTKSRTVFPSDDSLLKMLYLATMDITKKWTGRRRDWSQIRAQLEIYFEERLEKAEF